MPPVTPLPLPVDNLKATVLLWICVVNCLIATAQTPPETNLVRYVNPLIGTAPSTTESARRHSEAGSELKGQTFPAVGFPHGLTNWTPQTQATEQKCISPYYYQDQKIQGFRGSHWMSGSCTQDYGSVTIMPMTGTLKIKPDQRASAFSHANETAAPDYYQVTLDDYAIRAEVTGTTRAGILQFTYTKAGAGFIVIEPNSDEGEGFVQIHPERNEIVGYNPAHRIYQGLGQPAGFSGFFVAVFDVPFAGYGTWNGEQVNQQSPGTQGSKTPVGAFIRFAAKANQVVKVRVGTSFTSLEGARKNLEAEIPNWNFNQVRQRSADAWNQALGKVRVQATQEPDLNLFYTALYHTKLLPRIFSDADGTYPGFAEDANFYKAEGFTYYEDFSMWDTYRAVHPLLTLLEPDRASDMAQSLLKKAEQGGWLPIFPCWNQYTAAMIGDHATAMIGDVITKNIKGIDPEKAYTAMRRNAFEVNTNVAEYKNGKGRRALDSYLKYNYIPLEDSVWDAFHKREQVSRTLEYAYDDFVLAQVAKKLGKQADYAVLMRRAKNYQHVFDTRTGYVRGRYADGRWIEPFDPFATRASFITEGSPYQYTWYVPQDVAGLIRLMGGEKKFVTRLDTLFDLRYYWHGNEPGHQTVYLYPYAGAAWKTQGRVRNIIREEYSTDAGGLSGNEDSGQMSAWLAFSMMGLYPVCPGMPYYVLGSPVFRETAFTSAGGKKFTIKANKNSSMNCYIQSATLDGKPFTRTYLWHQEITSGGELVLEMGPEPNKNWGTGQANVPPSLGMGE